MKSPLLHLAFFSFVALSTLRSEAKDQFTKQIYFNSEQYLTNFLLQKIDIAFNKQQKVGIVGRLRLWLECSTLAQYKEKLETNTLVAIEPCNEEDLFYIRKIELIKNSNGAIEVDVNLDTYHESSQEMEDIKRTPPVEVKIAEEKPYKPGDAIYTIKDRFAQCRDFRFSPQSLEAGQFNQGSYRCKLVFDNIDAFLDQMMIAQREVNNRSK